jgi:hypothetical protein
VPLCLAVSVASFDKHVLLLLFSVASFDNFCSSLSLHIRQARPPPLLCLRLLRCAGICATERQRDRETERHTIKKRRGRRNAQLQDVVPTNKQKNRWRFSRKSRK